MLKVNLKRFFTKENSKPSITLRFFNKWFGLKNIIA